MIFRWLLLVLLFIPAMAVAETSLQQIKDRIEEQKRMIESGETDSESLNVFLEKTAREKRSLEKEASSLRIRLKELRRQAEKWRIQENEATAHRKELQGTASAAALPILAVGEGGLLKILFGRAEFSEIVVADLAMQNWMKKAVVSVRSFAEAARAARQAKVKADRASDLLRTKKKELEKRMSLIDANDRSRRQVLAKLRNQIDTYRKTLSGLQEEEQRLQELLSSRQHREAGRMPLRRTALSPIHVRSLRGFGPYTDRATGLKLQSTGVLYAAEKGTPILATADGVVVFADWFRGYGWMVILGHEGNYFTLYAHCNELAVKVGDQVKASERIADSGASGSLDGSSIYFEVRKGTVPVDPSAWLAR